MYPNRHRLPAPVALQREHRPRRDAAATTALQPQVLPHNTARLLEAKQSTRQRLCSGTIEKASSRFLPRGHRAEYRLSVRHHRQALKQPGPPGHLVAVCAVRQELLAIVVHDLPDDINPVRPRAPGEREKQALSSRSSLDDRCQAQGIEGVTCVGSHVVVSLRQREQCLRDVALCVVPLVFVQAAWNPLARPWHAAPSRPE